LNVILGWRPVHEDDYPGREKPPGSSSSERHHCS